MMIEDKVNQSGIVDNKQLDEISFYDVDLRHGLDSRMEDYVNHRLQKMGHFTQEYKMNEVKCGFTCF